MAEKSFNLADLKKQIDEFDSFFNKTIDLIHGIDEKYGKESKDVENEENKYAEKIIKDSPLLYEDLRQKISQHPLLSFYNDLAKSDIKLPAYNKREPFYASNIEDAHQELNKLLDEFKDLSKAMDEFNFSNGTECLFEGETLNINGTIYHAPNFPNLSTSDFDNANEKYKLLIMQAVDCLEQLMRVLEYICSYYTSVTFKDNVKKRAKKALEPAYQDIEKRKNEEATQLKQSLSEYYEKECAPVLEDNNNRLNDYVSMNNLEMPKDFHELINIGSTTYQFLHYENYLKEISQVDTRKLVKHTINFPLYLNLKEKGNVLINTNKVGNMDRELVDFVYQLVLQYIVSAPFRKMNLALVDVDSIDAFDFVYNFNKDYLKDNNLIFNKKIVNDAEGFRELMTGLSNKLNDIKGEKLAPKNCKNIFEYNEMSPENTQELYLFVYVNCPKCLDENIVEKMTNVLINGPQCGVFSIILNNESYPLPTDSYGYNKKSHLNFIEQISPSSNVFEFGNGKFIFNNDDCFIPNYAFREKDIGDFFDVLKKESEKTSLTNSIDLEELACLPYDRGDFANNLKIPVGKDGGQTVYLNLNVEGSNTFSAIIAGGSGSGKSTFLHTIILSAAYNFSPEELEFYLIDFKSGVEFSSYADRSSGMYIPHVSFVSLKNKLVDAYDVLLKIQSEQERRYELFKKANNAKKLSQYLTSPQVMNGELPKIPRLVVIIDEYQNFLESENSNDAILCNKCATLLTKLLGQIRATGISIILISQGVYVERNALNLIDNRYLFRSDPSVLQYAFPNFSGEEMAVDLKKEKHGLVYRTENGGNSKQLFKAAYGGETGKEKQVKFVSKINAKWGNISRELIISGSTDPLPIYNSIAPFVKFDAMERDKKTYYIPIYFGQSALSNELSLFNFADSDFCSYTILGSVGQSRGVETSIGLSFLYALKEFDYEIDKSNLIYLNLNNTQDSRRNPSPFFLYQDQLEDVMTYVTYPDVDEIANQINDLYNDYQSRKVGSSDTLAAPRLIIINSLSFIENVMKDLEKKQDSSMSFDSSSDDILDSSSDDLDSLGDFGNSSVSYDEYDSLSLIDKIKELYLEGYAYDIYVVIHEKRGFSLKESYDFVKMNRVICLDKDEIPYCQVNDSGDTVEIDDLPETYAVLFPDVIKVRPYDFDGSDEEQQFIDKIVEVLKK